MVVVGGKIFQAQLMFMVNVLLSLMSLLKLFCCEIMLYVDMPWQVEQ